MRKKFVQTTKRSDAERECWWAAFIVKVEGGYWCFESYADYRTWRQQS
jgi:hypothetical protein